MLGISCDSIAAHRAWTTTRVDCPTPNCPTGIPRGQVTTAYDLWNEERGAGTRAVIIVDKEGVISLPRDLRAGHPSQPRRTSSRLWPKSTGKTKGAGRETRPKPLPTLAGAYAIRRSPRSGIPPRPGVAIVTSSPALRPSAPARWVIPSISCLPTRPPRAHPQRENALLLRSHLVQRDPGPMLTRSVSASQRRDFHVGQVVLQLPDAPFRQLLLFPGRVQRAFSRTSPSLPGQSDCLAYLWNFLPQALQLALKLGMALLAQTCARCAYRPAPGISALEPAAVAAWRGRVAGQADLGPAALVGEGQEFLPGSSLDEGSSTFSVVHLA